MKQIKDLKENEVVLCKTQEECEAISELLHKEGMVWMSGASYIDNEHFLAGELFQDGGIYFRPFSGTWGIEEDVYTDIIHNAQDFLLPPQDPVKQAIAEIIKEWTDSKFQKSLISILKERL